jgi:hypothetical protein
MMEFILSDYFVTKPTSEFQLAELLQHIEQESMRTMQGILGELVFEAYVKNICEFVKNSIDADSTVIRIWSVAESDDSLSIVYFNDGQPFKNTSKLQFFDEIENQCNFKSFSLILQQNHNLIISPKRGQSKPVFGKCGLALKRLCIFLKEFGGDLFISNSPDGTGCLLKIRQPRKNMPFRLFQEFETDCEDKLPPMKCIKATFG